LIFLNYFSFRMLAVTYEKFVNFISRVGQNMVFQSILPKWSTFEGKFVLMIRQTLDQLLFIARKSYPI